MNNTVSGDNRPGWMKKNEVGLGEVTFEGNTFQYTILKKESEPNMPGFLGFFNDKYLFISEEVPEQYRDYQLIHELIEYLSLKGKTGRCAEALMRELELVSKDEKLGYLEYRYRFFENLVKYYKNSEDEEFKEAIAHSLRTVKSAYLEEKYEDLLEKQSEFQSSDEFATSSDLEKEIEKTVQELKNTPRKYTREELKNFEGKKIAILVYGISASHNVTIRLTSSEWIQVYQKGFGLLAECKKEHIHRVILAE